MNEQLTLKRRMIFTGIVTMLIWAHLGWDHFHEGVPTHHILHRGDLPGISNWWGGVVLPFFSWFLLYLIQKRVNGKDKSDINNDLIHIAYRFLAAVTFGILVSVFFTLGYDPLPGYMMIGVILLSFFVPLFLPEYFLGFVLGMTYTFGAILPIGFGIILTLIYMITYKLLRFGALSIVSRVR